MHGNIFFKFSHHPLRLHPYPHTFPCMHESQKKAFSSNDMTNFFSLFFYARKYLILCQCKFKWKPQIGGFLFFSNEKEKHEVWRRRKRKEKLLCRSKTKKWWKKKWSYVWYDKRAKESLWILYKFSRWRLLYLYSACDSLSHHWSQIKVRERINVKNIQ